MRTTLSISDALLTRLRRRARESGRPLREVVEESLVRGLVSQSVARRAAVKIKPRPLGLKAVYRKMSLNQLYDQMEAERTAAKSAR